VIEHRRHKAVRLVLTLIALLLVGYLAWDLVPPGLAAGFVVAIFLAGWFGLMAWSLVRWRVEARDFDRRERRSKGLCTECGYDLRGGHVRCPECGHPIWHPSWFESK